MAGYNPPIPAWFMEWGTKAAFVGEIPDEELGDIRSEDELFDLARDSIAILLPKLLDALRKKFHERYHMNASLGHKTLFYFFESPNALEAIGLTLSIRNRHVFLNMLYAPYDLNDKIDYSKKVEVKTTVSDPDLAGLALMRLVRDLLSKV